LNRDIVTKVYVNLLKNHVELRKLNICSVKFLREEHSLNRLINLDIY